MSFQMMILMTAMVILCFMLLIVGVLLYSRKYDDAFPPVEASCPDYWEYSYDYDEMSQQKKAYCKNVKNLGNCPNQEKMNFNSSEWNGTDGRCNKQKWARKCDLSWDGITNDNNACSKSSDSQSTNSNESKISKLFHEFEN